MRHGYLRVSTPDQSLDLQSDALLKDGCDKLWADVGSGAKWDRPQLAAMRKVLNPGDYVVVWKLDRLGRSNLELLTMVRDFKAHGVMFRSLSDGIDTAHAHSDLIMAILAAVAAMERDLIRERVLAGIAAAKARGTHCGRPKALGRPQLAAMNDLRRKGYTQKQLAAALGVARSTVQRALQSDPVMVCGIPLDEL